MFAVVTVATGLVACGEAPDAAAAAEPCTEVGDSVVGAIEREPSPEGVVPGAQWADLTPIPTPRIAYAAASLEGRIHVVGGLGGVGQVHEAYDPATDSWFRLPELPISTDHPWAATAAGRMYVGDGRSLRVFCYDAAARAWTEAASSTLSHGDTPAVGVIDNRIYVAGGTGEGMSGQELSRYDPETDTWTALTPMSCGRNHTVGAVIHGRFHVVGGRPGVQTCHEAYDPSTDEWERLADLPTGREGMGAVAVRDWLFVIGGEGNPDDSNLLFDAVEAYDHVADEWVEFEVMPTPRHGIFAAAIGDTVFLPGGGRMLERVATNDVLVVGW